MTGATGFLGGYLVKALQTQGCKIFALGRDLRKGVALNNETTEFVYLDLTKEAQVHSKLNEISQEYKVTTIFHCAALSSAWGKEAAFMQHNVTAIRFLLAAAHSCNIARFIFVSSTSVYFDFKDQFDISENAAVANPFANAYAKSKYLAEQEVVKYNDKLETVIIRPRGLIGIGDPAIVPRILKVAAKGWFPLVKNGNAIIDVTYIRNVADALVLAMNTPEAAGEIFNISNDEPIRVRTLLERLFELRGLDCPLVKVPYSLVMASASFKESKANLLNNGEPVYTKYSIGLVATSQTLNIEKAKRILGYQPKYSLDFAIKEYIEHMDPLNA